MLRFYSGHDLVEVGEMAIRLNPISL